jgi:hypothetical protein
MHALTEEGKPLSNLDEALERFHLTDLEFAAGLSNHGPMGAEALESLGHQALIPAFLDLYVPRLAVAPVGRVLSDGDSESALGQIERASDWVATFEARLATDSWRDVVARSVPPLIPGLFAGAGHGLLRTAHAIRSLEREDSPLRRKELARGLAYWSARYQTLPGVPGRRATGVADLERSFEHWPFVAEPETRAGLFFDVVRRLDGFPIFAETIEAIAIPEPADLDAFLGTLCRVGATQYLAHPEFRIGYAHAVTLPSSVRLIAPSLAAGDACLAAAHALQAIGALHSMFGGDAAPYEPGEEVAQTAQDWDEIRYRAACSIQEHAIKLAEACWREDRLSADPVFRLAAADAALQIDGRNSTAAC